MTLVKSRPTAYPFSAIVGQEPSKLALLLNAVSPTVGGVLIQGEKGNAKSTAVRALAELLPPIPVVPGCPSLCDPADPFDWCPRCEGMPWTGEPEYARAPFVDMPVSADEDRLVGHMDVKAAIAEGRVAFRPGLLAQAHRGILYVDEINLLPDHLVDALLDAAASGWNRVEREGFSVAHPARFLLIGTMNPEEGELRPQLLDRFGLSVNVSTPTDIAERTAIMSRRIAYAASPDAFAASWEAAERAERERLQAARDAFARVVLPHARLEQVARICIAAKTEGMRADLVICETAKAIAAYRGHAEVTRADVNDAAPLALFHRSAAPWQPEPDPDAEPEPEPPVRDDSEDGDSHRSGDAPGENGDAGGLERSRASGASRDDGGSEHAADGRSGSGDAPDGRDGTDGSGRSDGFSRGETGTGPEGRREAGTPDGGPLSGSPPPTASDGDTPPEPFPERLLPIDSAYRLDASALRRAPSREPTARPRHRRKRLNARKGTAAVPPQASARRIRSRPLRSDRSAGVPVDWLRTIRAAALRRALSGESGVRRTILRSDLREKVLVGAPKRVLLFVVDASGSMASHQRMKQTKAAILSLMEKAYQDRNLFAILCFRHRQADLLLPPTRSVGRARLTLERLASGGGTPLALGLRRCAELLEHWRTMHPELLPDVYVLTDGRVNRYGGGPEADALEAAVDAGRSLAALDCPITVIDTETGRIRFGLARKLAASMRAARYFTLQELAK